jgi:hypothetical protein
VIENPRLKTFKGDNASSEAIAIFNPSECDRSIARIEL